MAITLEKIEKWEGENNIKKLIKALRSFLIEEKNREAAAKALVRIGKPAVKPLIKVLLGFRDESVIAAAKALGDIGDDEAVAPLLKVLRRWPFNDAEKKVPVNALKKIGTTEALDALREYAIEELRNKKRSLREQTAEILDKIGWKPGDNAEKVYYLIAKEDWDELAKIGKPALESLILCLKDDEVDIRMNATRVLGKIGDVKAIDHLRSCLLLSPGFNEVSWNNYKALVQVVSEALASIGKPDIEPLIKELKDAEHSVLNGIPLLWALCIIGEKKAIEAVVDWIFTVPVSLVVDQIGFKGNSETDKSSPISSPDLIRELIPQKILLRLLGDYTDLIIDIFGWRSTTDYSKWDVSRCKEAIQKLCAINTPISNNILHKISKVEIFLVGHQFRTSFEYIDFKPFRKVAEDELKNRENPPYDPSVYLDEGIWKL